MLSRNVVGGVRLELRLPGVTGKVAASGESYCNEKNNRELNQPSRIHGYLWLFFKRIMDPKDTQRGRI